MVYNDEISYHIDIKDIMKNLRVEELVVLYILTETGTNQFFGLALEDILEDNRITENDITRTRVVQTLDKLKFVDAISHYLKNKRYYYYIKKNGMAIVKLVQHNEDEN